METKGLDKGTVDLMNQHVQRQLQQPMDTKLAEFHAEHSKTLARSGSFSPKPQNESEKAEERPKRRSSDASSSSRNVPLNVHLNPNFAADPRWQQYKHELETIDWEPDLQERHQSLKKHTHRQKHMAVDAQREADEKASITHEIHYKPKHEELELA